MPVAPGDVWRVAARLSSTATDPPEVSLITFWCQAVGTYSGPQDLGAAWVEAFHTVLLSLPVSLTLDGLYLTRFAPTVGPSFEYPVSGEFGSFSGLPMPTPVAVEVLKKSGLQGRANWGRTYLPWTPLAWQDTSFTNRLDPIAAAALETRMAGYADTLLGPNASGTSWLDGVYSYRSAEFPPAFTPALTYNVVPEYRSQGRRNRRSHNPPPFPEAVVPAYAIASFGAGRRIIWPGGGADDGREIRSLSVHAPGWTSYPTPPSNWTVPGDPTLGWDGQSCQQVHTILDPTVTSSGGYGWPWPLHGFNGGPDPFPYAEPLYTARTSPTACPGTANPGGRFDVSLYVRDFDLPDSPIFAAQLRVSWEQEIIVFINGFLVTASGTNPVAGPYVGSVVTADVESLLVPNATNRIAIQQTNNNVQLLHNPGLWQTQAAPPAFYNDYPFAAWELNVIQEPIL